MLTMNLNTGMTSMEKRLGADLMVVPQNTVQKAEALLTNGNPSTFYFTKDIADEVHGQHGAAEECQREDGDDGEQCAGAERLAFEVFNRKAAQCDMGWHDESLCCL